MLPHAQDKGITQSTVLEFWYINGTSNSDPDSGSDSSPDSHDNSDPNLYCLCFSFEEIVLDDVVIEPKEAVDIVVDIDTIVGNGLPPHMDKGDME